MFVYLHPYTPVTWTHHLPAGLHLAVRPLQRTDWLPGLSVSAEGPAPTRSLLSGMCSSTQTNLPHRLCRTLPQGSILLFGTRWLDYLLVVLTQLLAFIMRVFTWADQTRNKTKQNKTKKQSSLLCAFKWKKSDLTSSATSMPNPAAMNKNGMVTKIHTRIRTEPFTANYDLVGRELGRWVLFVCMTAVQRSLMNNLSVRSRDGICNNI